MIEDKNTKVVYIALLICLAVGCRYSSKPTEPKFSKDVNVYNYLDKEHELRYVYDFDSLIGNVERTRLIESAIDFEQSTDVTFILVLGKEPMNTLQPDEEVRMLNSILEKKFDLQKLVLVKINTQTRKVAMSCSPNLEEVLTDSVCQRLIEENMVRELRQKKYQLAFSNVVEASIEELNGSKD